MNHVGLSLTERLARRVTAIMRTLLWCGRTTIGIAVTQNEWHMARLRYSLTGTRLLGTHVIPASSRGDAAAMAATAQARRWGSDQVVIGYAGPGLMERVDTWPEVARVDLGRYWRDHGEGVRPPLVDASDVAAHLRMLPESALLRVQVHMIHKEVLEILNRVVVRGNPPWVVPGWAGSILSEVDGFTARSTSTEPADPADAAVTLARLPAADGVEEWAFNREEDRRRLTRRERGRRLGRSLAIAILVSSLLNLVIAGAGYPVSWIAAGREAQRIALEPLIQRRAALADALEQLRARRVDPDPGHYNGYSLPVVLIALVRLLPEQAVLDELVLTAAEPGEVGVWLELAATAPVPDLATRILAAIPQGPFLSAHLVELRRMESGANAIGACRFRIRLHATR